jgi:hypothetical protein
MLAMKPGLAIAALTAFALLAGCQNGSAPDADRSASPAASETAVPPPAAIANTDAPILKAASYPPRDDCADLPGWPAFRAKLDKAVAARDADALAALTDPDIRLDFGGGAGVKELRRRLIDPDYRLWDEIATLLPLGCGSLNGDGAAMPWIFADGPADADPNLDVLVLGSAVPAYSKPDRRSSVVARLDWALVSLDAGPASPSESFTAVVLPDRKTTAFVETAKLRSLIDYRLLATRTEQGWRITALLAGD